MAKIDKNKIVEKVKDFVEENEDIKKIFNFDKAGYTKDNMQTLKPYYTLVLKGFKNLKGKVALISPKAFISKADLKSDKVIEDVNADNVNLKAIKKKYSLPYIDTIKGKVFGINIAKACDNAGIKKIPALICGKDNENIEKWLKEQKIDYKFLENLKGID